MQTPDRFFHTTEAFFCAFPNLATAHRKERILCFTNGCFDLLHPGHVRYLEETRRLGDFLVIGLNSDNSARRLKGPSRPLQDEAARAAVLLALRSVDAVIRFDEDTPMNLIHALQPDILAKGGDYAPDTVIGREAVEARGGRVVILPFVEGHSSSLIETRIREGRGVELG